MQAKIINDTTLDRKKMVIATFLNNRFICITYSLLFVAFGTISLFAYFSGQIVDKAQLMLTGLLLFICLVVGILYPFIASLNWGYRYKKKYGVQTQDLEYHFFDIYMKIYNKSLDLESKLEYRRIRKKVETKKYILLAFDRNAFVFVDKSGFRKDNDLEKLEAYFKRSQL